MSRKQTGPMTGKCMNSALTTVAKWRNKYPQFFSAGWQKLCWDKEYRVFCGLLYVKQGATASTKWVQFTPLANGEFKTVILSGPAPKRKNCSDYIRDITEVTWYAPKQKPIKVSFESGQQFEKPTIEILWCIGDFAAIKAMIGESLSKIPRRKE